MNTIPTATDAAVGHEKPVAGTMIRLTTDEMVDLDEKLVPGVIGFVQERSHLERPEEITVVFPTVSERLNWYIKQNEYAVVTHADVGGTVVVNITNASVEDDPVNPRHYADLGDYAAIYIIEKWGLDFNLGQVLKYIQRAGHKPGESELTDLEKAAWYLQRKLHELDLVKHADPAA